MPIIYLYYFIGYFIMAYSFNPHRHVKIWLSKDKDIFLNLENRIRLVRMRDINPADEIYLVYDSSLLSSKALEELESFCAKYKITAKDVHKDVIPHCRSEEEKKLIKIYEDEISHLEDGGNLAVGSDVLRWLRPVYELGTYTDFDVHVDTRELPETISVEKPLLLSLGSYAVKSDVESICINNDTIAVVDSQEALSDIQKIQKFIYASCSKQPSDGGNFIERLISTSRARLSELFSPFLAEMLLNLDPNSKVLPILAHMSKGKTAREVRKEVIDITANDVDFGKSVLMSNRIVVRNLSDDLIITQAATR